MICHFVTSNCAFTPKTFQGFSVSHYNLALYKCRDCFETWVTQNIVCQLPSSTPTLLSLDSKWRNLFTTRWLFSWLHLCQPGRVGDFYKWSMNPFANSLSSKAIIFNVVINLLLLKIRLYVRRILSSSIYLTLPTLTSRWSIRIIHLQEAGLSVWTFTTTGRAWKMHFWDPSKWDKMCFECQRIKFQ